MRTSCATKGCQSRASFCLGTLQHISSWQAAGASSFQSVEQHMFPHKTCKSSQHCQLVAEANRQAQAWHLVADVFVQDVIRNCEVPHVVLVCCQRHLPCNITNSS